MRALMALTIANIKSYTRDRAAVFWTLAFPLIFIFLFGFIFQGGGNTTLTIAWVDEDGSPASGQLHAAFASASGVQLADADARAAAETKMKDGEADAIIVGISLALIVRRWWAKALWLLWPAWVGFSVISTGNHYWLDVVAGFVLAIATGLVLRRIRTLHLQRA